MLKYSKAQHLSTFSIAMGLSFQPKVCFILMKGKPQTLMLTLFFHLLGLLGIQFSQKCDIYGVLQMYNM